MQHRGISAIRVQKYSAVAINISESQLIQIQEVRDTFTEELISEIQKEATCKSIGHGYGQNWVCVLESSPQYSMKTGWEGPILRARHQRQKADAVILVQPDLGKQWQNQRKTMEVPCRDGLCNTVYKWKFILS